LGDVNALANAVVGLQDLLNSGSISDEKKKEIKDSLLTALLEATNVS